MTASEVLVIPSDGRPRGAVGLARPKVRNQKGNSFTRSALAFMGDSENARASCGSWTRWQWRATMHTRAKTSDERLGAY